jgi:membrane associated rhomboid family serine protease
MLQLACVGGNCNGAALQGALGTESPIQTIQAYPKLVAVVTLLGAAAGAAAGFSAVKGSPKVGGAIGAIIGGALTGWLSSTFVVTSG